MPTSGEGLKHEREAQNKTLEEMAEATGIRLDYLAALEQDAYGALPGRGFGKLYIRAYAEVLGFDPRPIIQEYDRAMTARESSPEASSAPQAPRPIEAAIARWRQERMAARQAGLEQNEEDQEIEEEIEHEPGIEEPPAEEPQEEVEVAAAAEPEPLPPAVTEVAAIEPEPLPPTVTEMPKAAPTMVEERRRSWTWPAAAAVLLLGVALAALWLKEPQPEPAAPVERVQAPVQAPASPPPEPVAPAPAPPRAQTTREPEVPAEPSHLTVTESAVGLRQVNGRVPEASNRFRVGQRVVFATRVEGGRPGERIRHVWMRDGKLEQSIRLRLGSAHYRTFSTKTLGRPGAWAVEARDEAGQVLARAEMTAN
ncbi:MAG TPA: DUF2914 domain-containing protein [Candidatus Polarisedimenticolaceae bacterium]|nr:DUF2914 domain-containing protein [Candidatus Polarisedimenticolaceae bacterium]